MKPTLDQIGDACGYAAGVTALAILFILMWPREMWGWLIAIASAFFAAAIFLIILAFADLRTRSHDLPQDQAGCDAKGDSDFIHIGSVE